MTDIPSKIQRRQLGLGYGVQAQQPASASVDVIGGDLWSHTLRQIIKKTTQVAGPFALCTGPGRVRWDLVYLDAAGVPQIEQGVEQAAGVPDFTGAPGNGGPTTAVDLFPLAYVKVDEFPLGTVSIDPVDITDLRALATVKDQAAVGELAQDNSAGAGGVLGTILKHAPADHQHPPNVDGTNPADVVSAGAAPGTTFRYARRDHVHQLAPALLTGLAAPMDAGLRCIWTPHDNNTFNNPNVRKWVLHQFQARAQNDPSYWFNVDALSGPELLTLWPVATTPPVPGNIGPGFADDTNPDAALVTSPLNPNWLFVYIIGIPGTTTYALVYSTNPPSVGPGLTDASFTGPGYTLWRWVTCIEMSSTVGLAVGARKHGNLVVKGWATGYINGNNRAGHSPIMYWVAGAGGVITLDQHISPLAMAAFMNWHLWANGIIVPCSASATVGLPPPGAGVMGAQDKPDGHPNDRNKYMTVTANVPNEVSYGWEGFWTPTDATRSIAYSASGNNEWAVWANVLAYVESLDEELSNIDWSP